MQAHYLPPLYSMSAWKTETMGISRQKKFSGQGCCNRILSKSKILWVLYSCEQLSKIHTIYQSTYFIEYFIQDNSKYPRIKKIHQMLEKIIRIDQKVKMHCVLLSHELLSTKLYYMSIYIFYILFVSRQFQKSKNDEYPTSALKDTYKSIFIVLFKLFSHLNLK